MEKIVETQEGRLGKIIFSDNGYGVEDGKLENTIKKKCKVYPEGGVLVHMTGKEYKFFQDIQDGEYRTISNEEHDNLLSASNERYLGSQD